MGEASAEVTEVDPIRGIIKVKLASNLEVEVSPEELTKRKKKPTEEEKPAKTRKRQERKVQERNEDEKRAPQEHAKENNEPSKQSEHFEFSVFVKPDGIVCENF